jgi:hypothetical protein
VDKNGNKNWLISIATLSLPPPLKKGNKFFENKLKFKPKAKKNVAEILVGNIRAFTFALPN